MVALEEKIENGPSGDLWKPEPAIESEISGTVSVEETQDRLQRDFFENVSLFSSLFVRNLLAVPTHQQFY